MAAVLRHQLHSPTVVMGCPVTAAVTYLPTPYLYKAAFQKAPEPSLSLVLQNSLQNRCGLAHEVSDLLDSLCLKGSFISKFSWKHRFTDFGLVECTITKEESTYRDTL